MLKVLPGYFDWITASLEIMMIILTMVYSLLEECKIFTVSLIFL